MKTTTIPDTFGARLRCFRKRAGLRQADVASLIGVSAPRVHQLETSTTRPDPETVGRLALALGLDPCDLDPVYPLQCRRSSSPGRVVVEDTGDELGSLRDLLRLAGDRPVVIQPESRPALTPAAPH